MANIQKNSPGRTIRRFVAAAVIFALLVFVLLKVESPLNVTTRLFIILSVAAAGDVLYRLLSKSLSMVLSRKAELLSPNKLIASMILFGGFVAALVGLLLMYLIGWVLNVTFSFQDYFLNISLFAIISSAVIAIFSLRSFIERWRALLVMEEELKRAVLKAEFETLKNQVNPHFLFNSLNILSALIPEDPNNAVRLVERLSKVFRYNLQHTDRNTMDLATELRIAESYLFIHQMRFGENLRYETNIPSEFHSQHIVTQSLLTLVENAIKHNECSGEHPLTIRIEAGEGALIVRNPIQLKSRLQTDSTGIGLRNMEHRYRLLTDRRVVVTEENGEFIVKIPLLPAAA